MRYALLILAACGSEPEPLAGKCADLSAQATQHAVACTIDVTGLPLNPLNSCPFVDWLPADRAPESIQCDQQIATFDMSQRIDGRQGLLVNTTGDGDCEFRECE